MGESQPSISEVGAQTSGLQDAMICESGVGDSGKELGYIVLGFTVPYEEYLHGRGGSKVGK